MPLRAIQHPQNQAVPNPVCHPSAGINLGDFPPWLLQRPPIILMCCGNANKKSQTCVTKQKTVKLIYFQMRNKPKPFSWINRNHLAEFGTQKLMSGHPPVEPWIDSTSTHTCLQLKQLCVCVCVCVAGRERVEHISQIYKVPIPPFSKYPLSADKYNVLLSHHVREGNLL